MRLNPTIHPLRNHHTDDSMSAARDGFARILGAAHERFDIVRTSDWDEQGDRYRVTGNNERILVEATTPSTAMKALSDYLASINQSISWVERNVEPTADFPVTFIPLEGRSCLSHRYYGNDTDDAYTDPFRSWDQWERLIDDLAALGFNEVFVPVGTEAVYFDVLQRFGYSAEELRLWIPTPAHQPWWLLQNMSGGTSGMTDEAFKRRRKLGRKIFSRLVEFEMIPVLPGYFGTVPRGYAERNPESRVIPQGDWVGFERPDWLDPTSQGFTDIAAAYYETSALMLGSTTMYKMDLLHEGGSKGEVDLPTATRRVEAALQAARPGAIWVILGWLENPPREIAGSVDPATTLIIDGLSDRYEPLDREADWLGVPYAFGTIWNFGGDTTLGAEILVWNERVYPTLQRQNGAMAGLAAIPEGGRNNPVALDFFAGLAWRSEPTNLEHWYRGWSRRRYGNHNEEAEAAWLILGETAYSLPTNDGFSEAHDSLFAAAPALDATRSSQWSPTVESYDVNRFQDALPLLAAAAEEFGHLSTYRYDVMDVARQVLSNLGRQILPALATAHQASDSYGFITAQNLWLEVMGLLDDVAGTHHLGLLGPLLDSAHAAGSTEAESREFERSQRSILTAWGTHDAHNAGLRDYAGRELQGLIRTYYKPRWKVYLDAARKSIETNAPLPAIDWYPSAKRWVESADRTGIMSTTHGDIFTLVPLVIDATKKVAAIGH